MNDDSESTLYRTAIDHIIARTIEAAVGTVTIDLTEVERISDHLLAIGPPTVDGNVTITDRDTVMVWVDGEAAAHAVVPGAFAHYTRRARR